MKIFDEGIIISKANYSQTSVILHIFSFKYGIVAGLCKGIKSSKQKYLLELGNIVDFEKIARIEEQLGFLNLEFKESHLSEIFYHNKKLLTLLSIVGMIKEFLIEKEVQEELYLATKNLIVVLQKEDFMYYYLQWEVMLLDVVGFGLDMTKCCVSGSKEIFYLSPKSGKSVCKEVGNLYEDKLFVIPNLWIHKDFNRANEKDLKLGFSITNYFFNKFAIEYNKKIPEIRNKIANY
jgi:DNA repair protein RecO (recombination protein O)